MADISKRDDELENQLSTEKMLKKQVEKLSKEKDDMKILVDRISIEKMSLSNEMETKIIDSQEVISGPKNCQINGNWSDFGLWMPCSKSCGNGTKRRFRFCTNPKPKFGGEECEGNNFEDSDCFVDCSSGINFVFKLVIQLGIIIFSKKSTQHSL